MGLGTQVFDREVDDHDRGRGHLRPHVHQLLAELPRLAAARPASRVDGAARAGARAGEVIDIQALLSAQSIGWYGPLSAGPIEPHGEQDVPEPPESDRLAS